MVGRLPSGIYFELLKLARQYQISTHQLMLEFIRLGLLEKGGWKCDHDMKFRKFSRKAKQWYCSNCWTFFDRKASTKGLRTVFTDVERLPVWELKKEMSAAEWAKMTEPQNDDMK